MRDASKTRSAIGGWNGLIVRYRRCQAGRLPGRLKQGKRL